MAGESAFTKRLTAETTFDKVEGLLEHFNLPPKVIRFIRSNLRVIQAAIAIIVATIVFTSIYSSYRERIREEAATALSKALQQGKDDQAMALVKVANDYSSTSSALWAKVELAHLDMQKGAFAEAGEKYQKLLAEINKKSPLYPLVLLSRAQAYEAEKKYAEAAKEYDLLKAIKGYEHIGYTSMGRLEEVQGNIEKAIAIYNNFLLSLGDDASKAQSKEQVEGKVARLKARL